MANDWKEILNLLPHKFPFILVDKVLEYKEGVYIKTLKNVSFNEPFFSGHFPDNPLMPGVLIIETVAQSGGLFIIKGYKELADKNALLVGVNKTKFMKEVRPGDQMIIEARLKKRLGNVFVFTGTVMSGDQIVAETEIIISVN